MNHCNHDAYKMLCDSCEHELKVNRAVNALKTAVELFKQYKITGGRVNIIKACVEEWK